MQDLDTPIAENDSLDACQAGDDNPSLSGVTAAFSPLRLAAGEGPSLSPE